MSDFYASLKKQREVVFASVADGSDVFVVAQLAKAHKKGVIYVAHDDVHMMRMQETLGYFFADVRCLTFPAWDCIPYDRVSPHQHVVSERLKTLSWLTNPSDEAFVLVTTSNAIVQRVLPPEIVEKSVLSIHVGDHISRQDITHFLVENGYANSASASEPGEFSERGSIVDIIPTGEEQGYRLDFFGDEVESIRLYDPITQISAGKAELVEVIPASEVMLSEATITAFRHNYRSLFGSQTKADPLYEAISEGRKYSGMEHWMPLFYSHLATLSDYLPEAVYVFDHLVEDASHERLRLVQESYQTRKEDIATSEKYDTAYNPIPYEQLYLKEDEWQQQVAAHLNAKLYPYQLPEKDGIEDAGYKVGRKYFVEAPLEEKTPLEMMLEDCQPTLIKGKGKKKVQALIACMSEGSRSRIETMLVDYDCRSERIDEWASQSNVLKNKNSVGLSVLNIATGFVADGIKVITEEDLFGERIFRARKKRSEKSENFLAEASHLIEGELVVHKSHGIGRFEGLETLDVAGIVHDFILLIYHGGDKLYIPVENIDVISRYGGSEEGTQLDKLGGVSWQQRTARIKKRITIAAEELIEVAAKRASRRAPVFSASSGGFQEFCARFPYTETDDQLNAIEDVLHDLQSGRPLDRLVCGDVGFGKTEVALRAAFVVAHPAEGEEKGQVAVIVPTTLLSRQHYKEFVHRYAGMGITIRQISRLVPPKEIKETKAMLEAGEVDIVVGTHALLSNDVKFKRLSLVVVDEEQRFGVAQKEKLKKLQANTHVLTLTATPIPRTLQLSLSGIRELSLIATAPIDRLAIRTYVLPFDPMVVRDAILREHYRGGRTYYVCPRIKDVEEMEVKLKELVPEVKVVAAHGRMTGVELDKIMTAFADGVYDVLLSTTIIESGIDISVANTMVIHRADMFGLSQLYQLRGRVGRSKVRAYAYLTVPPKRIPTKQAEKRLEVMQKLDNLGAGFTLASHDMDIRGFGNLLGDEQSGNIKEVGVELYQAMLQDAIDSIKQGREEQEEDGLTNDLMPKINMGASVLIPEQYVPDLSVRMGLYRRIAQMHSEEEISSMAVELVDRFGAMPQEVQNLLSVVGIKRRCLLLGIEKLDIGKKGLTLAFYKDTFRNPDALIAYIQSRPNAMKIRGDGRLTITHKKEIRDIAHRVKWVCDELDAIVAL